MDPVLTRDDMLALLGEIDRAIEVVKEARIDEAECRSKLEAYGYARGRIFNAARWKGIEL